jgi:predicted helicase
MELDQYVESINRRYRQGNATEHTFRGDLQQLIETLLPDVSATNEPKRQTCGAPDYILTRRNIPVGFIEAKDIGDKDLEGVKINGNKEQFDRYKASLSNILFTDYLNFYLYREGQLTTKIAIGEVRNGSISPLRENFAPFTNLLKDFSVYIGQTITSSKRLAEMMAAKARLLSDVIEKALTSDDVNNENSTLKDQMNAFRQILIHDITPKGFADVYAQTIAYGMFAARLHDPTLPTFSRGEAAELIPRSNPFLRKLFGYIAGPDIDDRIKWIVDSLVELFLACNVEELLKSYGKVTKREDPIIHFYETFLSEYDPKLRKARGVWYTPQPAVSFIVRAVDYVLKSEFGLSQGLADFSKTKVKVALQETDKRFKDNVKTSEEEVHRVQILDPATGTGTFLAEVIQQIYKQFKGQEGIWNNYVNNHLLPRITGFELLMASYAMAHLKLDLLLSQSGYKPATNQRFRVYLTNSLEESHPDTGTLFANWLSAEANEANRVKRDTPVMCVIGNPPYSISSTNKGTWILNLLADYKAGLNERKINLDDDYIKFIRYGQYFVERNGSGILAYITNNSFIDGITHRQMRKHLLEVFDKIYILDLHGSTKKNETASDGSKDENVFDIQQGVSINIFVKTGKKKSGQLAVLMHSELQGSREYKYQKLSTENISEIKWENIRYTDPYYFFVPKDFQSLHIYEEGFSLNDLFTNYNSGVQTKSDDLSIHFEESELIKVVSDFTDLTIDTLRSKYNRRKDTSGWTFQSAVNSIKKGYILTRINYRPFDDRLTAYTSNSGGFIGRPREGTMKHIIGRDNISLIACRQQSTFEFQHIFLTDLITDLNSISLQTKEQSYIFPLYLYSDDVVHHSTEDFQSRIPNLDSEIVGKIASELGLLFTQEIEETDNTFAPIDILDYIYAVLNSPGYREKYKEILKIDFPRVPYPKNPKIFWHLVELGREIRQLHLLKSETVEKYITMYPVAGDNIVNRVKYQDGNVYINDSQYFSNVPEIAWNFFIGGYQPAQKWLKDRKDRALEFNDILHYQKIIVALTETSRIMKEIDKIQID